MWKNNQCTWKENWRDRVWDVKSRLIGKDPFAGKEGGLVEKGVTKDEMVGWYHRINIHGFEQTEKEQRTGKPSVLQFMGSQSVGNDLAAKSQQIFWEFVFLKNN